MGVSSAPEVVGIDSACRACSRAMSSCGSATTILLMTALSSRGRFVPVGGWPTADAERLCAGWEGEGFDLLELPWCRGLSFPFLRVWAASGAVRAVEGLVWRWDEVRGGGMGALTEETAAVAMA